MPTALNDETKRKLLADIERSANVIVKELRKMQHLPSKYGVEETISQQIDGILNHYIAEKMKSRQVVIDGINLVKEVVPEDVGTTDVVIDQKTEDSKERK